MDNHPVLWTFILLEMNRKVEAQIQSLQQVNSQLGTELAGCRRELASAQELAHQARCEANSANSQARTALSHTATLPSNTTRRLRELESGMNELGQKLTQLQQQLTRQVTFPSEQPSTPRGTSSRLDQYPIPPAGSLASTVPVNNGFPVSGPDFYQSSGLPGNMVYSNPVNSLPSGCTAVTTAYVVSPPAISVPAGGRAGRPTFRPA